MSLTEQTADSIRSYLRQEGLRYIAENMADIDKSLLQPFHAALMPDAFAGWSLLSERSFSTRSGSWFQQIAVRVARQFHRRAETLYAFSGPLTSAAGAHIDAILEAMDRGTPHRLPNRAQDIKEVLTVQAAAGMPKGHVADLFVERNDGVEMYFEMKTPKPNKDTSKAMKEAILVATALRMEKGAEAYGSAAYNPYGDGNPYRWNYALQFMELGTDFLVGRPFWEKIGDSSTYDEVLAIASEVGHLLSADIHSRLEKQNEEPGPPDR